MISFEVQSAQFEGAMLKKIDGIGLVAPKVLRDEAGKLAATLIKISGPKSVQQAKQRIDKRVSGMFEWLSDDNPKGHRKEASALASGGVHWYAWDGDGLFGVAADKDMRQASVDELYQFFKGKRITKSCRMAVGKRGKQTVYLWMRALTKKETVRQLVRRIQNHIGRRQAGWLKAWRAAGAPVVGNPPPAQVLRNEQGARGSFIDGTSISNLPEFTIINQAVGSTKLRQQVARALQIRSKAIMADLALYIRGIKKPEQYSHLR